MSNSFTTPWTVARHAPLSMEFSRQEYWRGLPFPSPGDLPWPRDRTQVSHVAGRFFNDWATREASLLKVYLFLFIYLAHRVLIVACEIFVAACTLLVVWTLSCERRIWFPDQGLNPGPLHWERWVLATGPPGKSCSHIVSSKTSIRYLVHVKRSLKFGPIQNVCEHTQPMLDFCFGQSWISKSSWCGPNVSWMFWTGPNVLQGVGLLHDKYCYR